MLAASLQVSRSASVWNKGKICSAARSSAAGVDQYAKKGGRPHGYIHNRGNRFYREARCRKSGQAGAPPYVPREEDQPNPGAREARVGLAWGDVRDPRSLLSACPDAMPSFTWPVQPPSGSRTGKPMRRQCKQHARHGVRAQGWRFGVIHMSTLHVWKNQSPVR